jgi:ESS family glutamate:Na+ symporter
MSEPIANAVIVPPLEGLAVAILVLFLGFWLTRRFAFLRDNYIPPAVSGGLVCSGVVACVYVASDLQVSFDMSVRDALLLVFFSTIGLNAKFRMLAAGGRSLAILVVAAALFLVVQNTTGVLLAVAFDAHPGYGLFAGSVSLAGGHGTAIAWGAEAEAAGLEGAATVGIAFATFGLVAGGLIGGPIAGRLIEARGLRSTEAQDADPGQREAQDADPGQREAQDADPGQREAQDEAGQERPAQLEDRLGALLAIALSVGLGDLVNQMFTARGVLVPGFLTALLVGVILTNAADALRLRLHRGVIDNAGELSLAVFLSMSLMSMQLWTLAQMLGVITIVMAIQVVVITLFVMWIVFRVLGATYDAAVITAGFAGMGLGATPVAIANMNAVTSRYGPSTKAFLVVPLVGAFFIDILNASIIKFFIGGITRLVG